MFQANDAGGSAGAWGSEANCADGTVVIGVCGSGANPDCGGTPAQVACATTSQTAKYKPGPLVSPQWYSSGTAVADNWGQRLTCGDSSPGDAAVLIGVCGSGANMDCGGKPNYARCARLVYGDGSDEVMNCDDDTCPSAWVTTSNPQWISVSEWGGWAQCPDGMVATGFCGSGANKDCNGNVVEIQCSTVTLRLNFEGGLPK